MAELTHFYDESNTETFRAANDYGYQTGFPQILGSSLSANTKYLIVARALIKADSTTIKAGFRIGRGPSVGRKREGTLASIDGNIPYLTDNDIKELRIDIRSTPYRDYLLSDSRENILKRRITDIRMKRAKGSLQAH